jgi:hypothetical protein
VAAYNHLPPTTNNHHQSQQMMYPQQLNYQQYYQHKANASQQQQHPQMPKPNHPVADKRILSILRNSLETKNANQQRLLAVR